MAGAGDDGRLAPGIEIDGKDDLVGDAEGGEEGRGLGAAPPEHGLLAALVERSDSAAPVSEVGRYAVRERLDLGCDCRGRLLFVG